MTKRPKSKFLKLLIVVVLLMGIFFSFLAFAPFFFKEDIVKFLKEQSNEHLDAELSFQELELSLLSDFPAMTLEVNQLNIKGKGDFKDIYLLNVEHLLLELDLWKILIDGKYEVHKVILDQPEIHVSVLGNGLANYDIYKTTDSTIAAPETTQSSNPFEFKINSYEINNASLIYEDELYETELELIDFTHKGVFVMNGDKYLLETESNSKEFNLTYDDVKYFNEAKLDIVFNGEIVFIEDDISFLITKNRIEINELITAAAGDFLMKESAYEMHISFETMDQSFKSLLSVVPGLYRDDFSDLSANGEFGLKGQLTGVYDDVNYPKFNIDISVNNGDFKYAGLEHGVNDVKLQLLMNYPGGSDLDLLSIYINNFSMDFLTSTVQMELGLSNLISDPNVSGLLMTNLNLGDIDQVIPLENEKLNGVITTDLKFKGVLSSIEQENYDLFVAEGGVKIESALIQSTDLNYPISIAELDFKFSPQSLSLENLEMNIGESDFSANGRIQNYLQYWFKNEALQGEFIHRSAFLDLDEILYEDDFSAQNPDSFNEDIADTSVYSSEIIDIPENINFTFHSSIDRLQYDSLPIHLFRGDIVAKNGELHFNELKMDVFDGQINMGGYYEAISKSTANLSLKLKLIDFSFKEAYNYFNTVKKYAPLVRYFDGDFTTELNVDLVVDENYMPVYEHLNSDGKLKSNDVKILDFPTINMAKEFGKDFLEKNNKIKDLNLSYHFQNGQFYIEKTTLQLKDNKAEVQGSTSVNQDIDYHIATELPIDMFNSSLTKNIQGTVGSGIDLGKVSSPVPVLVNIAGTIKSPNIKTSFAGVSSDIKEDLIEKGKELVEEQIEEVKKDVLAEAQKQADKLKREAQTKAELVRNESNAKADLIEKNAKEQKVKAQKQANIEVSKLKREGYAQADKLVKEAKSPLAKVAAQKSADKLKKSTDAKASELEKRLNKETDKAEEEAKLKAQRIREEGDEKANLIELEAEEQANKILENAIKK